MLFFFSPHYTFFFLSLHYPMPDYVGNKGSIGVFFSSFLETCEIKCRISMLKYLQIYLFPLDINSIKGTFRLSEGTSSLF